MLPRPQSPAQRAAAKANRQFSSLSPADKVAVYVSVNNLGPCKSCTPTVEAVWATWGAVWNAANNSWSSPVYV